jgi:hypothetical protein
MSTNETMGMIDDPRARDSKDGLDDMCPVDFGVLLAKRSHMLRIPSFSTLQFSFKASHAPRSDGREFQ